jgi:hypothetical protein
MYKIKGVQMKRVLVLLVVALFMVGFANAQTSKIKIGVGPYIGLPMGSFGDVTSIGFGGLAQGEYDLAPQIVGTVTAGYLSFSGKSINGVDLGSWSIIPILVGGKYFFTPNMYGAIQIGLNMVSYTAKVPYITSYAPLTFGYRDETFSSSEFGFNIGVGYEMKPFDFLVKYGTFGSDASAISLTALYKFSL